MADRYPLIYNPSANQIQELQAGDNLDLDSSGISNVSNINSTGIATFGSSNGIGTVTVGVGTTALLVQGHTRVIGTLSVGEGTIIIDGTNNTITVGSGITLSASGGIQASSISVSQGITGTASTATAAATAYGLSGSPNISVNNITSTNISSQDVQVGGALTVTNNLVTNDVQVGGALTVTGNLTVNGTQTIINTTNIEVSDKTIGINSVSSPSDSNADGAGIVIYATTNKSLTWDNANSRMAFSTDIYASRYYGDGSTLTNVSAGNDITSCLFT